MLCFVSAVHSILLLFTYMHGTCTHTHIHTHTHTHTVIYPPSDLTLERQFVDYSSSKTYKAVVSWTPPLHLPTAREVEYRVYVNGHLCTSVPATADTKVLLSDLPLHVSPVHIHTYVCGCGGWVWQDLLRRVGVVR